MITRLPRWIWVGGAWLAFAAGMINAVGLLGTEHRAVTHLTGAASLSVAFALRDLSLGLHLAFIVLAFVLGPTRLPASGTGSLSPFLQP